MDLNKVLQIKVGGEIFVDYKDLHPFQGKLKSITEEKFHDLVASLEKSGLPKAFDIWIDSKGNKWVHDGHHRLLAFKSMEGNGWFIPPIPCNIVKAKNKKEAAQLLLISNSTYAHMTQESLSDFMIENELLIPDLEFLDLPDLDMRDFDLDESENNEGNCDPDEVPDDVPTKVNLGDLFELGEHRLICGDSTDIATIERLMNGEKADITFSSPPYNLGNNAKLRGYNGDGDDSAYIEKSDHKTQDEYLKFMSDWTSLSMQFSTTVFCNVQLLAGNKLALPKYWMKFYQNLIDLMIWDKEHAAPQMAARVLNSVFEMIFIFTNENEPKRSIKTGKHFRGTLQNIYRLNPLRGSKCEFQKDHGAVFPVAFAEHFIMNFSENSVLDLFGGSGSTIIACEKTNRKCFMSELYPHYVDVIINRWQQFTGNKAYRLNDDGTKDLYDDL